MLKAPAQADALHWEIDELVLACGAGHRAAYGLPQFLTCGALAFLASGLVALGAGGALGGGSVTCVQPTQPVVDFEIPGFSLGAGAVLADAGLAAVLADDGCDDVDVVVGVTDGRPTAGGVVAFGGDAGGGHHAAGDVGPLLVGEDRIFGSGAYGLDKYKKTSLDDLLASACERRPNGVLEPFKAHLNERFTQLGSQGAGHRLFREVRDLGYRGSVRNVQRYLARLDNGTAEPVRATIPSPSTIASWITRPREALKPDEEEKLLRLRLACPDITRARDLAWAFLEMARHQRGALLPEWIRQAEQDAPKPISGFAGFLRQDLAAVTAGLTLPWSSGIVEGHVNRVKTIKRAMYGRASFQLLRSRILIRP